MEKNNQLIFCPNCLGDLNITSSEASCMNCGRTYPVNSDIPLFSDDKYWGKISEKEFYSILELIKENGFSAFSRDLQKKIDFTFDEDRADWRFMIPFGNDFTVLDLGAGLGRISIPLARVARKVVSCDLSLSRMLFLKERAKDSGLNNIETFVGDVFNLPFKEESFDLIVMNGVLEWVGLTDKYKSPREAQIISLEICRKLLKKGGYLYIGIENRAALLYLYAKDHGGLRFTSYMPRFLANIVSKLNKKGPYRTYTYTKRGYEKILKESGFTLPPVFFLPYPGYNLPRSLIPYDHLESFKYLLKTRKKNGKGPGFLKRVFKFSVLIRLYRRLFYSFSIFAKK